MGNQVFDKSKILVAGLHEIEAGKRYYVSNDIDNDSNYCLRRYVENKNERQIQTLEYYREGKYRTSDGYYTFAYPYEEPAKKWRPIKTIEEAETFLGKKIKSKDGKEKMLLTECFLQDSGSIKINKASPKLLFDCYLQEDGSPIGIKE